MTCDVFNGICNGNHQNVCDGFYRIFTWVIQIVRMKLIYEEKLLSLIPLNTSMTFMKETRPVEAKSRMLASPMMLFYLYRCAVLYNLHLIYRPLWLWKNSSVFGMGKVRIPAELFWHPGTSRVIQTKGGASISAPGGYDSLGMQGSGV